MSGATEIPFGNSEGVLALLNNGLANKVAGLRIQGSPLPAARNMLEVEAGALGACFEIRSAETLANCFVRVNSDLSVTRAGSTITLSSTSNLDFQGALTITGQGANAGVIFGTALQKVGFYGHAPAALQTGVAVSAEGIHAALVNLGLITA